MKEKLKKVVEDNRLDASTDDIWNYIYDKEYIANKHVLKCFTVTMLIYTIVFILNLLNIFIIEERLMYIAYSSSMLIYLLVRHITKRVSLSNAKVKYFILTCTIMVFTISGIFLSYHAVILPLLSFLYATLYSSKRVMRIVYVQTVISTVFIVYGSYYFGLCDANMVLLTAATTSNYITDGVFNLTTINPNPAVNLMLFYVFPRCGIYIAFMSVCSSIFKIVSGSIEKAKLSEELEQAKVAAEKANSAKTEFINRMSHEIRTPINAIMGMNEMIIRESKDIQTQGYATDIKNSASALLGMVNEILDSAKIESGKMEIVPVEYHMGTLINDVYNMVNVKAVDKGIKLVFDIDSNIPSVYLGDDLRIRQVLLNLLTNAIKYSEEGVVTLTVSGNKDDDNNYQVIHFSVKDNGIGIKAEDIDRLFDKFERIDEKKYRNVEGTGLGLDIAHRLLALMGSKLEVESEYGVGSDFYFSLIQQIVDEEPLGDYKEKIFNVAEYNHSYSYTAPDVKVLIVDDNDINRKVFVNFIKKTKIDIHEASSGKECLDILGKQSFDLVFLDYMMPGMDGVETFEKIKEQRLCENTPVIMLTANAIKGAREEFIEMGFSDYLTKPILPDKLDKMILAHLSKDKIIEGANGKDDKDIVLRDVSRQKESQTSLKELDEFDFDLAIETLGSEELLLNILEEFAGSMNDLITKLNAFVQELDNPEKLSLYAIEVHALKGTSATVGALLLSKLARLVEVAAKEGNVSKVKLLHPILVEEMDKHKKRIIEELLDDSLEKTDELENDEEDYYQLNGYLDMLISFLEDGQESMIDIVCGELSKLEYSGEMEVLVREVLDKVKVKDKEGVIITANKIRELTDK